MLIVHMGDHISLFITVGSEQLIHCFFKGEGTPDVTMTPFLQEVFLMRSQEPSEHGTLGPFFNYLITYEGLIANGELAKDMAWRQDMDF